MGNIDMNGTRKLLCLLLFVLAGTLSFGQSVPLGMFYQAVARDNFGKELASRNIDIRFSIIKGNKLGTTVYQELHSPVITSKYGVFSLIIGKGAPTDEGIYKALDQIDWSNAYHFLKIEVKFENDFVDMGTMQFLAVPYALYAQKSLEPGPQGPRGDQGPQGQQGVQGLKGEQGDPATDDQTLSFDGSNISISGGNTVNLSSLLYPHQLTILGDTLAIMGGNKVGLPNQIQDLQLDANNKLKITKNSLATEIDFTRFLDDKQTLAFNSVDNTLNISGGNTVNLASLKDDADANPLNEIQTLTFTPADNKLYISGITDPVDLTALKNDADASPTNELQDLSLAANKLKITNNASATEINLAPYLDNTDNQAISYNAATNTISLTNGGSASLGSMVAFRAKKNIQTSAALPLSNVDFIPDEVEYNDGLNFEPISGEFSAPVTGVYTFDIKYVAPTTAVDGIKIMIYKNGNLYEYLGTGISNGITLFRTLTIKLLANSKIKFVIHTGTGVEIGTGSFSGFRVY